MARRRDHENHTAQLTGKGGNNGQGIGRDVWQRRRRKDNFHSRAWGGAGAIGRKSGGGRLRRRPAQPRSGHGGGTAGGVWPPQRGAAGCENFPPPPPPHTDREYVAASL